MSGGGSRGSGAAIPAGTKKMVQSLKEIVNCTEQEIYATLKECNMDPNEAINRLISEDTFHEVKSKREKKKEAKETPEPRSQKVNSSSNRGVRGGTDRGGRSNTIQVTSNDNGVTRGKAAQKKENGANTVLPTSSVLGSGLAANNSSTRLTLVSNSDSTGNTVQSTGLADSISLPVQSSSTFQHNWSGMRGHLSMADIVKLGRPQGKPSAALVMATDASQSYTTHNAIMPNTLHDSAQHCQATVSPPQTNKEFHSSQDIVLKVIESSHEPGITISPHKYRGEWTVIDHSPPETDQIFSETSGASSTYPEPPAPSTLHVDGDDLQPSPHLDEVLEGDVNGESLPTDSMGSASISDRQIQVDRYGGNSCLDDVSLKNMSSYQSPRNAYECHKVEDANVEISSAASILQQLSLHKEQSVKSAAGKAAVIIPDHLQVTNADCSHLSFGSFGSGISASFSGAFTSKPLKSNLEVPSVRETPSSIEHSEVRESEYYDNEQLQSTSNDSVAPTMGTSTGNYDVVSASQPEVIRDDTFDATRRLQHNSPSVSVSQPEVIRDDTFHATHGLQHNTPSVSGYAFSSTTQPNDAVYAYAQSNSQMQNLPPFSSAMQPYTNSLPSNMLASAAQPYREFDLPFLPLLSTQSVPAKYSTSMSSGPPISMPEDVKPGFFSIPQPTPQTLLSTSASTNPALPQHLPVHPYSQPTHPLGPFANMIGYPFLPQSFAYMPSFQQAYSGSSAFHQSPAALNSAGFKYTLPQFKSSISVNSLPPSAAVASGYGGFGSSANIPGSFTQNPSTVSASASVGFEEALGSQYKDGHRFLPLHQNENSPMWVHGAGSRTVAAVPAGTYYGFQGQNPQSGIRQSQQPSHFGALGHPNLYHSQAGISQEHQQYPSEGNLNGSRGPASQQSHHNWPHNY